MIDARGIAVLIAFAATCILAARARPRWLRISAHVLMLGVAAGLFLHVIPGFNNPRLVTEAMLSPDAVPYTKYLNVDKGAAGLLLLALYGTDVVMRDEGWRHLGDFTWRFLLLVAMVIVLSLAFGYVRWDPKLPSWWMPWLWSTIVLTALPEEALFRGVLQTALARWWRRETLAAIVAGLAFGLAHIAGGWTYVVLASAAGIGYGLIFASTGSISCAILAHAGLDAVHFFLFTYPALRT